MQVKFFDILFRDPSVCILELMMKGKMWVQQVNICCLVTLLACVDQLPSSRFFANHIQFISCSNKLMA